MKYYVKTTPTDDGIHKVHREDCQYLPREDHRRALGEAAACNTAMDRARETFDDVDGCATCCPDCSAN
jgi:hypothetical protein